MCLNPPRFGDNMRDGRIGANNPLWQGGGDGGDIVCRGNGYFGGDGSPAARLAPDARSVAFCYTIYGSAFCYTSNNASESVDAKRKLKTRTRYVTTTYVNVYQSNTPRKW